METITIYRNNLVNCLFSFAEASLANKAKGGGWETLSKAFPVKKVEKKESPIKKGNSFLNHRAGSFSAKIDDCFSGKKYVSLASIIAETGAAERKVKDHLRHMSIAHGIDFEAGKNGQFRISCKEAEMVA